MSVIGVHVERLTGHGETVVATGGQGLAPIRANSGAGDTLARLMPLLLGLALPVTLAAGWELAVWVGFSNGRLMPPPSRIARTLWELAGSGELTTHIGVTTARVAIGFALGAMAATVLGALTGAWAMGHRLLDPMLQALRAIPSIAWVPLFILWFGIFEGSKVALIAMGVFFPVYLGVAGAIHGLDRKIVEVARVYRLSRLALARRVLLPAVLPDFVLALRSGLGLGWMFVVAAELMGASEGVGFLLIDGQQTGKPAQIVAAIVVFAVLGKASDWLLTASMRPLTRWQDNVRNHSGEGT